ncbi:serine/threonine-protein kinase [Nakamurella sp. GG22]
MTAAGTMITGRYRLVQQLAVGGMGSVWEAWDELLQRPVAVKQLLTQPGSCPDDTARLRVIREARITARLHHPHAVTLYDVVEQDGHPCLIMQFVPSKSLSTVLRETGTLDIGVVTRIGADLASALTAAHRVGIVHRDVKPGNVLISEDGSAKLTDFGISHAVGDVSLTSTGIVTGTPAYLAPEVARGEPSGFPADVFSLAATMYAALEGFPPFGSDPNPMALLHRVASGRMLPPQQSGPLTPLLLRMLSTQPTDRPSMAEVLASLTSSAAAGQGGSAPADRQSAEQATFRRTVAERAPERPPPPATPTLGLPAVAASTTEPEAQRRRPCRGEHNRSRGTAPPAGRRGEHNRLRGTAPPAGHRRDRDGDRTGVGCLHRDRRASAAVRRRRGGRNRPGRRDRAVDVRGGLGVFLVTRHSVLGAGRGERRTCARGRQHSARDERR